MEARRRYKMLIFHCASRLKLASEVQYGGSTKVQNVAIKDALGASLPPGRSSTFLAIVGQNALDRSLSVNRPAIDFPCLQTSIKNTLGASPPTCRISTFPATVDQKRSQSLSANQPDFDFPCNCRSKALSKPFRHRPRLKPKISRIDSG